MRLGRILGINGRPSPRTLFGKGLSRRSCINVFVTYFCTCSLPFVVLLLRERARRSQDSEALSKVGSSRWKLDYQVPRYLQQKLPRDVSRHKPIYSYTLLQMFLGWWLISNKTHLLRSVKKKKKSEIKVFSGILREPPLSTASLTGSRASPRSRFTEVERASLRVQVRVTPCTRTTWPLQG